MRAAHLLLVAALQIVSLCVATSFFDLDYALSSIPDHSPRKIALLHLHDNAPFFSQLGALTLANKRRYAARHQYEVASYSPQGCFGLWASSECDNPNAVRPFPNSQSCVVPNKSFFIDQRAPTFGKIKLALAACHTRPNYWLLWSDADAMIINQTVPLESIIDDRYDILVSVDWLMINAGVLLFKCSPWTQSFLQRLYDAREFDSARALDQSAFQHFFDTEPDMQSHLKHIPKSSINVYTEEYRPGDFLVHMAGKLYEATTTGATAIAHQFDILSSVEDIDDVNAFFQSQYLLNAMSGVCLDPDTPDSECKPDDERRSRLKEPMIYMSEPNRYKHVGLRYYWLQDWEDKYDVEGWNDGRVIFDPSGLYSEWTENITRRQNALDDELSVHAHPAIKLEGEQSTSHDEL